MKPLAKYNKIANSITPITITFFMGLTAIIILKQYHQDTFWSILIFIVGFIWVYLRYKRLNSLFYTNQSLILKNGNTERKIPLTAITKVKAATNNITFLGIRFTYYTIYFTNELNKPETVSFFSNSQSNTLIEFKKLVV